MAAVTRWVSYDVSSVGTASTGDNEGKGTRGYSIATASVGDTFSIGPTTNRLHFSIGGVSAPYITLYSGSNLDPRFVARDITEKIRALNKSTEDYDKAICKYENDGDYGNRFVIYPGELGAGSQVVVVSGTNSAHSTLGWNTKSESGGSVTTNSYGGGLTVSGTYYGLFSEVYKIVVSNNDSSGGTAVRGIGTPTKGGSNSYAGTMTTGGVFNHVTDLQYIISVSVTNGTTMGAGTGNVPTISWTSTGSIDDSSINTELLYPNTWYNIGRYGLMVKFSDAVFNTVSPAWTIDCYQAIHAQGSNANAPVGTAQYVYSSDRGDMSSSPITTASGTYTQLGARGLGITFGGDAGNMAAGDEFFVICNGPDPTDYNISSLNYGNVTVSTESAVKNVMFEIESGAIQMSTVKFGLQNHGSFKHHNAGNSDTYFRFGTVGVGNKAGTGIVNAIEWYPDIASTDIDSDAPPTYLYATEDNLPVVSTADSSVSVGNNDLIADPIWLNIRLGAAETGANSLINYRLYFDYT